MEKLPSDELVFRLLDVQKYRELENFETEELLEMANNAAAIESYHTSSADNAHIILMLIAQKLVERGVTLDEDEDGTN